MKKIGILSIALTIIFLISCKKNDNTNLYIDCEFTPTQVPQNELDSLERFISTNEIIANFDERGFYYIIDSVGEGLHPTRCYQIIADYRAYNFNGSYVDNGSDISLRMHKTIEGFQYGLNNIGVNGKIKIFLPPTLAYGEKGSSPAVGKNEYLIFEITLKNLTYNNLNN